MRQFIGISRIWAILFLTLYIIFNIVNFNPAANICLVVSTGSFAVIILLQLYRFYIANYLKKETQE